MNFKFLSGILARVENETCKILKCLRFDRGIEFILEEFNTFDNDR